MTLTPEKPGQGLQGRINDLLIQITHRHQIKDTSLLPPLESGLECIILINDKLAARMVFHDEIRKESKAFISHLQPRHYFNKIMIVSGDRQSEVEYLAKFLNIKNIFCQQTPEQKLEIVQHEKQKNHVVFMGDGINDAPALEAADVGIAFGTTSEISAQSADAVIMESHLGKVDELIHLSQNTKKIALQSGLMGIGFSFLAMILASLKLINPVEGAIIQELIDVFAILNALRLVFLKDIQSDF